MSYKLQGSLDFQGLNIKIENRTGSVRIGTDADGTEWETKMQNPYGYISGTFGTDGDEVDCFIGDNKNSDQVFVAHIQNPETGKYDEDKVMLGFNTEQEARDAFRKHYDEQTFLQGITPMNFSEFKDKLTKREGKMIKAVNNIIQLFKGIKVPNLVQIDLFKQTQEGEPKEGKTVTKDGQTYQYKRSKKNPSVLRLFKEGEKAETTPPLSLFGNNVALNKKPKNSSVAGTKKTTTAFHSMLELFNQPEEKKPVSAEPIANEKPLEKTPAVKPVEKIKKADNPFYDTIYGKNYRNLKKVIPNLDSIKVGDHFKLKSDGYMDLSVEGYGTDSQGRRIVSMGQFGTQNGDLMSDPRMEIAVDSKYGTVEALTFENHYAGTYSEVYDDMFEQKAVNLKEKKGQNSFLGTWIQNLIEQGHKGETSEATAKPESTHGIGKSPKPIDANEPSKESKPASNKPTTKPADKVEDIEYTKVVGKKNREKLNTEVRELLATKENKDFTKEDKEKLIQYTGRGNLGSETLDDISLNEFYTLPEVTEFMWKAIQNLGFKGGQVLEPSCATGNFIHTAPQDTLVTGVEIDPVSGRVADILYGQNHDIRIQSFEQFNRSSDGGEYNAVIGNAPFGVRGACVIDDPAYQDVPTHEQYFILRGIDDLKAYGILGMIVPTGIMDNQLATWRLAMNKKAEFLGAVRMPTGAFKHANAQVTTDIVFFRKRPQQAIERLNDLKSGELDQLYDSMVLDNDFISGKYFEKNPQYALGKESTGQFGQKIWQGDLKIPELNGMMDMLKRDKDDYVALGITSMPSNEEELHVGDMKQINGRNYRLNENHRWERINEEDLANYTCIPEDQKEKLRVNNLAELTELQNDISKITDLTRDQISVLGGDFGNRLDRELQSYTGKSDYQDIMVRKAVTLGLAIRDFQLGLQEGQFSTSDAQKKAEQLGGLVKQFVEVYGDPTKEAKLTKFLGRSVLNPILYIAGAIDLKGDLSQIFKDPIAFTNVYKSSTDIGVYDSNDIFSITQYLVNNHIPGDLESIRSLYTGDDDLELALLHSEDVFLDENMDYAPIQEVCVGDVYWKLDAWADKRKSIKKKLESADPGRRNELELLDKKLENQIFELRRRAGIKELDYLPVMMSDAGKLFSIDILNQYLDGQIGANFADKLVYDDKLKMIVPVTGIHKELYLLFANKGANDKKENARLKELLKLYFKNDDENNPFYLTLLTNINGINRIFAKDEKAERLKADIAKVKSGFVKFLKGHEQSDAITDRYNRAYNNYLQKQYDESPIENLSKFAYDRVIATTPNGREVTAREKAGAHTWALVRRMYDQKKGLVAHGVGLGKTLEAIVLTLLHKETGRAKKPLIVTPKSVLKNWLNEIDKWTVGVNYVVVGMKKVTNKAGVSRWVEENAGEKRVKLMQIASGEYDMVLMSRDTFGMIDLAPETKKNMLDELVEKYYPQLESASKLAKKKRDHALQQLSKMMENKDAIQGIYLENLGFDMMVRDEAHDSKNLLQSIEENIKGVNSTSAQRSTHNLFASKIIRSQNNEGGFYSLTATPISNSPLEVFNMLLPVAEKELADLGINNMDDFIRKFAIKEYAPTTDTDGRVIMKEKFGGWSSPDILRKLFFRFTDYKTKDDVQSVKANIKFPNEKPENVMSTLNEGQKKLFRNCQLRIWTVRFKRWDKDHGTWKLNEEKIKKEIEDGMFTQEDADELSEYFHDDYLPKLAELNTKYTGAKDEELIDDCGFSIQSDMIKIASDLDWYNQKNSYFAKQIDEDYVEKHNDLEKIKQLNDSVLGIYKNGGKQLIFAINTKLHDKLKKELTDMGIPSDEICVVNGVTAKDPIKRSKISEDYNSGKYKVIIGNYATMGEGLNFNKLTSDIHHLQPAWNYLQIEQGNGRGIRQGNDLDFVNTHYYLSKGSIDSFMSDKVRQKGKMTEEFMKGESNTWNPDVELSLDDMMISMADNPDVARKLLERRNVSLQNAIKEKKRMSGFRNLEEIFDLKFRMNRVPEKDSRQYKQLEQELERLQNDVNTQEDFQHKDAITLDKRPIIMPEFDTLIPINSIIKYSFANDNLAIVKNYTHSTGRVELETWNAYSGVQTKTLTIKQFEAQYGKTIEKTEMDLPKLFDKLINEDKTHDDCVISRLPVEILKQHKSQILKNLADDENNYHPVIYRDMDGIYKIADFEKAKMYIDNEGGKIVFPQEDENVVKFLHKELKSKDYDRHNKAESLAEKYYGENYENIVKRLATGQKEEPSKETKE
jgi:SNF2 family DNA or RNA helicase/uncharacterized protein YqiB (DUF1249 family)